MSGLGTILSVLTMASSSGLSSRERSPGAFQHVRTVPSFFVTPLLLISHAELKSTLPSPLSSSFFSGCHPFIPLFDPSYDTYESIKERSPWTFDALLAIAGKIRSGTGPPSGTFYKCLEEAQGIARSSLFGPVVRKEAVQGM